MVQILPYVPGFVEKLSAALQPASEAFGSYLGGKLGKRARKAEGMEELQALAQKNPQFGESLGIGAGSQGAQGGASTPLEGVVGQAAPVVPSISPFELNAGANAIEKVHGKSAADSWVKRQETDYKAQKDIQTYERKQDIKAAKALEAQAAERKAGAEEMAPVFEKLHSLVKYGGKFGLNAMLGKIPFTPQSGKREELDKLGIWTADAVYVRFNKGMLAKVKWDDIKNEFATNSQLTDQVNHARIRSMETIMGLPADVSAEKFNKVVNEERKKMGKVTSKEDRHPL